VENKTENDSMDGGDSEFAALTREGEKNSRDEDEEKDGGIKGNENTHYILFIQNNIDLCLIRCHSLHTGT
jgi:hypothetical protein